jgi:hypothetical protein
MSGADLATPAAKGVDLEFVIEELDAIQPEAIAGDNVACGCGCIAF